MRVYIGTTYDGLRELYRTSTLGPAPLLGHAVTPALRESYAEGDSEELEYVALTAAADACLPLIAASPGEPPRRYVAACDVQDVTPDAEAGRSGVVVPQAIPWRDVKALHADDPEAAPTMAAAASAYAAAMAGDDDARFTVDEADGWELMWFATQEVDDLLGG